MPVDQLVQDGVYVLENAASGKVLDVPGGGWDNGLPVAVWQRLGPHGSPGQQWAVEFDPAHDAYTLRRPDTEKFLDVAGASRADGAVVQVWEATDSDAQRWRLESHGPGGRLAVVNLGSGRLLTAAGDDDGAAVWQRTCTGADHQLWQLDAVS
ncbi:hypothetical protein GCM10018793_47390 [Streptomyces sulfonofaciens]|uniref:Ricin B lectin domain-containing protein n=1 Tax=Streptomyces sulfonofaciens TaxID=68272 RepID=A0A919GHG7_9ACTN|nr:RICIN domain-containing protein [Streptomyces sulfonofaciens]GHH84046.1 hypothetical protein GCM10018793_47390 [Streptomyces sulfonofaciens]